MHIFLYHFYSRTPNPVYQEIAANLRQMGHIVWLGSRNEEDNLEWHDGEKVVATITGPYSTTSSASGKLAKIAANLRMLRYLGRVRAFVKQIRPDIIQANVDSFGWILPIGKSPQTTFMYDIRQINEAVNSSWKQRFSEWRSLWTMKLCARFVYDQTFFCHSKAAERVLGRNWKKNGDVIPVGIDQHFLNGVWDSDGTARVASPDKDSTVKFLYIGSLSRLRNLDQLIHAASELVNKGFRNFKLDFLGPDQADGYYQDLIEQLNLSDYVAVKPPVDYQDVPQVMTTYDVGLAYTPDRPTWHYQPTIKVLEYRAIGLPILSTDVATHREIVEQERNGLLVADEVNSLAEAMSRYLDDEQFLIQCRSNAIVMRQGTTWSEVAEMYANVYKRFVSRRVEG